MDDYFGSGKTTEKRIGGLLGSFVPAIFASVADVADDEARSSDRWYSGINRIPGARNYNEKAKNPREPYLRNRINRIIDKFDPLSTRPANSTDVSKFTVEEKAIIIERLKQKRANAQSDKAREKFDKLIKNLEE